MAQTNHDVLGQGLKLYTDAMRELIRKRLGAAMPNNWWEQGVLRAVSRQQGDNLRRERDKDPDIHPAELLEPAHFRPIVTRNRGVFDTVFPKFQAADSYLSAAVQARNDWAHPRSGDILVDDAEFALNAMARLLAMAGAPRGGGGRGDPQARPPHRGRAGARACARTGNGDSTGRRGHPSLLVAGLRAARGLPRSRSGRRGPVRCYARGRIRRRRA